jgi:hypothetical protein
MDHDLLSAVRIARIFEHTEVTPYAIEIALWMLKESDGRFTPEYVYKIFEQLGAEDYITPFTVLKYLQNGMDQEKQRETWDLFKRAVAVLDKKLLTDYCKPMEQLLKDGYSQRSAIDLVDYCDHLQV